MSAPEHDILLVFYGTLRRGHGHAVTPDFSADLTYICSCLIPGELYDAGKYPLLRPGADAVLGELYSVRSHGALKRIDEWEGDEYSREVISLLEPTSIHDGRIMAYVGDAGVAATLPRIHPVGNTTGKFPDYPVIVEWHGHERNCGEGLLDQ